MAGYVYFTDQAEFETFETSECLRRGLPTIGKTNGYPQPDSQQTTNVTTSISNLTPGDNRVAAYIDANWPSAISSAWIFHPIDDLITENFFEVPPVTPTE